MTTTMTPPPAAAEHDPGIPAGALLGGGDPGGPRAEGAFAHWPLPVGRVELRDGLTYVHAADPRGFTAEDHRRIPGGGRIELLDGVAVVHPAPTARHRRVVGRLYRVLDDARPPHLVPFAGPLDLPAGPQVLAPDLVVLPAGDGPPALVADLLPGRVHPFDVRGRSRGYRQAGVASYWVVDPDIPSVTVFELDGNGDYGQAGSYSGDDVCALDRPFPVRFQPSDLV